MMVWEEFEGTIGYLFGPCTRVARVRFLGVGGVANAVFRTRGIAALRKFTQLRGDTDTLLRAFAAQLEPPATDSQSLDAWWRKEAKRASSIR